MNRKIKILQFPIANSYGGITHYALENWKWMDKDKFQCDFATMSKQLDFADKILSSGSKIHYISCYAEKDKQQFIKEVNTILDEGYDIVHLHTKQWKSFLIEQICKERKVPKVIVHSHSSRCDANDEKIRAYETKEHYKVREQITEDLATDYWACSQLASDWLFGNKIPKEKIHIMNNAIELDKFIYNKEIRSKLRTEYNLEDKIVIGNVGRLVYQKNQSFLLDVFAEVYKVNQNYVLVLIGEGALEQELKLKAKQLGITNAVLFMGKRSDVNKLYQMMDIFALPSNFEGLPITLIEVQTAGIKSICSDVITKESDITGNVKFLPLKVDEWKREILNMAITYPRNDMTKCITDHGYNIRNQIKLVEKMYMEK